MNDVRSETATDRSLERADHGREQSRPTGSLRLSDTYEMGFDDSPLATHHYSCISTRFYPKGRSHTKHTTKPSLPGSRFAHRHARTSFASALSNRELRLLEPTLTHRKQTIAPCSNRELSTNRCRSISDAVIPISTFLTGSASQTEFGVTNSKQTTGAFLTGSRFARYGAGIDTSSRLAQHGARLK
jgi:hypothetical protein